MDFSPFRSRLGHQRKLSIFFGFRLNFVVSGPENRREYVALRDLRPRASFAVTLVEPVTDDTGNAFDDGA